MAGPAKGIAGELFWDSYRLSPYMKDMTVSAEQDELDTTVWSTGAEERSIPSFKRTTATLSGLFDSAVGGSDVVLATAFGTTSPILSIGPEGAATGKRAKLLRAIHTSYAINNPVNDVVSFAAGIRGTTRYESGAFLRAPVAVTSTGSSTGVDNGAATATGGVGHLHITAASTLTSITVKVQHSSNNSAWSDLISFTASTATGVQRSTVAGSVKRYTRSTVSAFTGGAAKSVTHAVAFARHI